MDPDLIFVIGVVVAVFSVPAMVSAMTDGRAPRAPLMVVVISGLMIGYAMQQNPGAYSLKTLPDVFVQVVARFI